MGKSTAADMLRDMGVPVHDSDQAARASIGPGGPAVAAVAAQFPAAYRADLDAIDRTVLGPIVFADPDQRKILESIVHPHVRAAQQDFVRDHAASGHRIAVLDIPLLYETGAESRVDRVIVVTCPGFIQKARVLRREGMTIDKFKAILKTQLPDRDKRCRADYVVQTGLGRGYTKRALQQIIQTLMNEIPNDKKRDNFSTLHP